MNVAVASLVVLGLSAPAPARADDYRIAAGAIDAASVGVVLAGTALEPPARGTTMIAGAVAGLIGVPLMLFQLERPERAAISLGAHAVLPLGTLFAVGLATPNERYYGWSLLAGFAAATAIDVALAKLDDPAPGKRVISVGGRF